MVQIVKTLCDNANCRQEIRGYKIRLTHEYSSRSMYGREYCSTQCVIADMQNFKEYARKKDMSA